MQNEKKELIKDWHEFMKECPPIHASHGPGTGAQDIEMIDWCESLNDSFPFLCTESSCAGHRYICDSGEEVFSSGLLWIRLTRGAMRKFEKKVFELRKGDGIENVYKLYSGWEKELIGILFAGVEHNYLDQSMNTIYTFFKSF
jgi:hypothetical protein